MTDYEPLLRKAIAGLESPDQSARDGVYERVRQALVRQLQTGGRSDAEIDRELESFLGAIARLESETANIEAYVPPPRSRPVEADVIVPEMQPAAEPRRLPMAAIVTTGILIAAVAAASIVYLQRPREAASVPPPPRTEPAPKVVAAAPAPTERLAPTKQVSNAASEDTASYWLRRQRVFYRTTHPPGTIVVSLNQRFLYLVQPNQVAIRYAIGIGPACDNAVGLFHITEKIARATPRGAQTDAWFDPPALYFDKGRAVHEAKEPGRIGQSATAGCFQSWDQDIADLFERISVNDRIVIAN